MIDLLHYLLTLPPNDAAGLTLLAFLPVALLFAVAFELSQRPRRPRRR